MKITVDRDHGVIKISFAEEKIERTEQYSPGILADFSESGELLGVEIIKESVKDGKEVNLRVE